MSKASTISTAELETLDRFYREGGLRAMASPHVHYDEPTCPHPGCSHQMEWIDFKLELHGDPEGIYKPLVRAWWEGRGFVGRCPSCQDWIRFTTLEMEAVDEEQCGPVSPSFPRTGTPWLSSRDSVPYRTSDRSESLDLLEPDTSSPACAGARLTPLCLGCVDGSRWRQPEYQRRRSSQSRSSEIHDRSSTDVHYDATNF